MIFKNKLRNPTIKYDKNIKKVTTFRYLGGNDKLNFNEHIEATTNKLLKVGNKLITLANTKFK